MNKLLTYAPTGARLLLGLIFTVFGLNGFLHFIPIPPAEGAAGAFMGGLAASGYFFPLLAGTQVVVGLALLTEGLQRVAGASKITPVFVALALVVLAPITVHIVAFHTLAPDGMGMALLIVALQVFVAWSLRDAFRPLLAVKVQA